MPNSNIPNNIFDLLTKGCAIPALPLALDSKRNLDEKYQRALMRYYLEAGSGGVAVGVHTTQFAIHNIEVGLYKPILQIAKEEFDRSDILSGNASIRIAGVIGETKQAVIEAQLAKENNYHAILLSLAAFSKESNATILNHCKTIAEIIPLVGFYLQPSIGGRRLDFNFWKEFAEIENVIAIKIAPFNRYQTIDVIRAVIESGRSEKISLYTGNDDNIIADLITDFNFEYKNKRISKRIVGGLLGHWAVWTRSAVKLLEAIKQSNTDRNISEYLTLAAHITDCNAAFFDAANNFSGCIVGIHEVLRRQGLLKGIWTLDKDEMLSPGQLEEIDRVYNAYPELNDDDFVSENLDKWLS